MSAERYYTTIKPHLKKNGMPYCTADLTPLYEITTQSYPDVKIQTASALRSRLILEGRILQPIKWAAKLGVGVGIAYALAASTNHLLPPYLTDVSVANQITSGEIFWLASTVVSMALDNRLARWNAKKDAFNNNFPNEKLHLIPEKYHPINLLRRK